MISLTPGSERDNAAEKGQERYSENTAMGETSADVGGKAPIPLEEPTDIFAAVRLKVS